MVRTRSGWLVAVLALGLGAAACKKNEKKADQPPAGDKMAAGSDTAGAAKPDTTAPAAAAAGVDNEDLALLPVDSELVMGLNFAQLQQSALWKQFSPKIMEKMSNGLNEFKTACGFDPMEQIKSVSVGMKGLGGGTPDGAFVIHGLDKAKSMACLDKAKAEAAKKNTEITVDGDVFMVKDPKGQTSAFTFTSDSTLLGVVGPNASKDGVLAAAKGGSALKTSPMFVDMYGKINTNNSLWLLMNGNSPALSKMGSMGVKPQAIFGSVNVTDGLALDLRLRMHSPDEATQLVNMLKGQFNNPQVKQMFDKADVSADGNDAKFDIAMSNQKLQQLIGMVGGMMGGMMGGGGMGGAPGAP